MDEDALPQGNARRPLEWEADEYTHAEKTPEWYWALGLIAIAGVFASLRFENILFAVFILVASFVLALFASRKPERVIFAVTQRGVRINDELFPYQSLKSFAIDELSPDHTPKLILEPDRIFAPRIIIPIEGIDPDEVHEYLRNFLQEEDHIEPLSHRAMEWFGF